MFGPVATVGHFGAVPHQISVVPPQMHLDQHFFIVWQQQQYCMYLVWVKGGWGTCPLKHFGLATGIGVNATGDAGIHPPIFGQLGTKYLISPPIIQRSPWVMSPQC